MPYRRTLKELEPHAVLHWPEDCLLKYKEMSVLPLLLKTQDSFLSLIKCASKTPTSWINALGHCGELNEQLFLKHLMIISDIGGEALNKLTPLERYLPDGEMRFIWKNETFVHKLKTLGKCNLSNAGLKVSAENIVRKNNAGWNRNNISQKLRDICMLLLYGSCLTNDFLPKEIKEKCVLGEYLGAPEQLDCFVKQRYLFVSKQIGGTVSNALGQIAQQYVVDILKEYLNGVWDVKSNETLPNVSHIGNSKQTNFDIVVRSPSEKYYGVEVSFQVTTNSVIERKARESKALMRSVHSAGHKICYVIDGAGNIKIRTAAVGTLCEYSDCTVAMSPSEIKHLAEFMLSGE